MDREGAILSIMKRGFTLIELLVVISIISMLATIGILNFNKARIKGRDAKRKADLATIQQGLESFYEDNRQYPVTSGNGQVGSAALTQLVPTYLPVIASDPKTLAGYYYSSTGSQFVLSTLLEGINDRVTANLIFDSSDFFCVLNGSSPTNRFVTGVCDDGGKKYYQASSGG